MFVGHTIKHSKSLYSVLFMISNTCTLERKKNKKESHRDEKPAGAQLSQKQKQI